MKRVFKFILIVILIVFVGVVIAMGVRVVKYKKKVAATTIDAVDMSLVRDGIYQGEYDMDFVYVKLAVSVKSHRIQEIKIVEHKHGRGAEAEKQIPTRIIQQQSAKVDAVSGATNSSKAIMKAVELALKAGIN